MKKVALKEIKAHFSKYLRLAERDEIVITRRGRPAGVLIGFGSEDEWFDFQLQKDPRFVKRIESAREDLRKGRGTKVSSGRIEELLLEGVNSGRVVEVSPEYWAKKRRALITRTRRRFPARKRRTPAT